MNTIRVVIDDNFLEQIRDKFNLKTSKKLKETLHILDTFDFRLFHNSLLLYRKDSTLYKKFLNSTESIAIDINKTPTFISELDSSSFKEHLEEITKPRKLIELFKLEVISKSLTNKKINLELKSYYAIKDGKKSLIAHKIIGKYSESSKQLLKQLAKFRIDIDVAELAIKKLYHIDNKSVEEIQRDESSSSSFKKIFQNLLILIKDNTEGSKEGLDIEFLHDFRVSIRKTRSMLKYTKEIFDTERVIYFQTKLKELAQHSNILRDLDVQILDMIEYQKSLPANLQKDMNNIITLLRKYRKKEQKAFKKVLNSKVYIDTIEQWEEFLESTGESNIKTIDLVSKNLDSMYHKISIKANKLTINSKGCKFHSLRIEFKKFRYLLEFFLTIFENPRAKELFKATKETQKILGTFQDLEMQQDKLKNYSIALFEEDSKNIDTIMILGKISTDLAIKQNEIKENFFTLYEKFKSFENEITDILK